MKSSNRLPAGCVSTPTAWARVWGEHPGSLRPAGDEVLKALEIEARIEAEIEAKIEAKIEALLGFQGLES